jgi:hypothetical protein
MIESTLTNAPIPGQGLTQDPASKLAIESPTEDTEINATVGKIFDDLTSKDKIGDMVKLLKDGEIFMDRVASAYIEQGVVSGKWNTDMAHLLVEPVLFVIMWIASQVGAPMKFRDAQHFDSSGMDVLESAAIQEVEEEVISLLAPEASNGQ